MSHINCPNCGRELPKDARFCFICGAEIPAVITCPSCGRELPAEARFCTYCGTVIEAETGAAQTTASVSAMAAEPPKAETKPSGSQGSAPEAHKREIPKLSRKAMIAVGGGAAALLLVMVLTLFSGGKTPPENTGAASEPPTVPTVTPVDAPYEEPPAEELGIPWENNVLRYDVPDSRILDADEYPVFGSGYTRDQIATITFLDSLDTQGDGAWDVSAAGDGSVMAWVTPEGELFNLYIGGEGGVAAPEDCSFLFGNYINATAISLNDALHTENTVDMSSMFARCKVLTKVDVGGFDTARVQDMNGMFSGCWRLKQLDVAGWDTARVENMGFLFYCCYDLARLDPGGWDTARVSDMQDVFAFCQNLTALDLCGWDTSRADYMDAMFFNCKALRSLNAAGWDTTGASKQDMFEGCGQMEPTVMTALLSGGIPAGSKETAKDTVEDTTASPSVTPAPGAATPSSGAVTPSVSGKGTLVAAAMTEDPLAYTVGKSSVYVQNLADFATSGLTVKAPSKSSDGLSQSIGFTGGASGVAVLEDFVNTICGGSYNLKMIKKSAESYKPSLTSKGGDYVSWAINYTGTGKVSYKTKASFSNVECNLYVYYKLVRGELQGAVFLPAEMDVVDLGLRYGGKKEATGLAGPSAMEALYRLPGGGYTTGDGRLSAAPGYATVLRDGRSYSVPTGFVRDEKNSKELLWIRNFYRDETIYLATPISRLMTGDIYTLKDLLFTGSTKFKTVDAFDDYIYNPFFGLGHNGEAITPRDDPSNQFEDLTVRVMYWEPNKEAVYYIYAKLSGAPYEIEALCSVDLSNPDTPAVSTGGSSSGFEFDISAPGSVGNRIDCSVCGGDALRDCYTCGGRGKVERYESGGGVHGVGPGKRVLVDCSSCRGSGQQKCMACGGDGKV